MALISAGLSDGHAESAQEKGFQTILVVEYHTSYACVSSASARLRDGCVNNTWGQLVRAHQIVMQSVRSKGVFPHFVCLHNILRIDVYSTPQQGCERRLCG